MLQQHELSGPADAEADAELNELNTMGIYARFRPGDRLPRDQSIIVRTRYDLQQDVQVRNLEFSVDWCAPPQPLSRGLADGAPGGR